MSEITVEVTSPEITVEIANSEVVVESLNTEFVVEASGPPGPPGTISRRVGEEIPVGLPPGTVIVRY